jgi:hypothetical protein
MPNTQVEYLIKAAALVLGAFGVALVLAFVASRLPRLLGTQASKLDDKYFIVDFSGLFLALGIACLAVAGFLWIARSLIARMF